MADVFDDAYTHDCVEKVVLERKLTEITLVCGQVRVSQFIPVSVDYVDIVS